MEHAWGEEDAAPVEEADQDRGGAEEDVRRGSSLIPHMSKDIIIVQ